MNHNVPMTYHAGIQGVDGWPVGGFGYHYADHNGERLKDAEMYCYIRMNDAMCVLPVSRLKQTKEVWKLDGDLERPTLKPSVLHRTAPDRLPWHGFVTNGELVTR